MVESAAVLIVSIIESTSLSASGFVSVGASRANALMKLDAMKPGPEEPRMLWPVILLGEISCCFTDAQGIRKTHCVIGALNCKLKGRLESKSVKSPGVSMSVRPSCDM